MIFENAEEAAGYVRSILDFEPQVGIVLGTGLGNLVSEIEIEREIPYKNIPHFSLTTVEGHSGKLILGHLSGKRVIGLAGRFHYYEGRTMQEVTFPIRVLKLLGVELLIISNAAGSTNAKIGVGDLVFIRDHINFHAENPLRGENEDRFGPRFPDMLNTYSKRLNDNAMSIAKSLKIKAHTGVYFGLSGPSLETPAEYRMINILGGDVVGMSTVPEVIVAQHMGMEIFVVSVATNKCFPIKLIRPTTLDEVIEVANSAEPKLTAIVKKMLSEL